jgi:hypothetical protein
LIQFQNISYFLRAEIVEWRKPSGRQAHSKWVVVVVGGSGEYFFTMLVIRAHNAQNPDWKFSLSSTK